MPTSQNISLPLSVLTANNGTQPNDWQSVNDEVTIRLPAYSTAVLATSGIDYRYWFAQDKVVHHLVNPFSENRSDIVNASILINTIEFEQNAEILHPKIQQFLQHSNACNLAQTLSKLCCLLGFEKSMAWLYQHHLQNLGLSFIIATEQGFEQWLNPTMESLAVNSSIH